MVTSRLVMTFNTSLGKKVSISVDNPRADLMESEVGATMDMIVSRNIFNTNNGDIVATDSAKIVTTDVQALTI